MLYNAEIKSKQEPFILFEEYLKPKKPLAFNRNVFIDHHMLPQKIIEKKINHHSKHLNKWQHLSKVFKKWAFKFFPFLRGRNDDHVGVWKPKTAFEIYCSVASIHGFSNFTHASTQQRFFWTLIMCTALTLSIGTITITKTRLNVETPTTFFVQSSTYPIWKMPFPAVTLCGLNRISRKALAEVSQELRINATILKNLLWIHEIPSVNNDEVERDLRLLQTILGNISWPELITKLAPKCSELIIHCKWQGSEKNCTKIFKTVMTTDAGLCCTFNYHLFDKRPSKRVKQCGYKSGLSIVLDTNFHDYAGAVTLTPGFQLRIHGTYKVPEDIGSTMTTFIQSGTDTRIDLRPRGIESTTYIRNEKVNSRKCYFDGEVSLSSIPSYSQTSCQAECRSKIMFETCGCIPPFAAGSNIWPVCDIGKAQCLRANKNKSSQLNRKHCKCFPQCNFYLYDFVPDYGKLYIESIDQNRRVINNTEKLKELIQLYVFYGDIAGNLLIYDVTEDWLQFLGTFGGITGLFMGSSFISVYEILFLVLVSPACNWFTRQHTRYRLRWRQRLVHAKAEVN